MILRKVVPAGIMFNQPTSTHHHVLILSHSRYSTEILWTNLFSNFKFELFEFIKLPFNYSTKVRTEQSHVDKKLLLEPWSRVIIPQP